MPHKTAFTRRNFLANATLGAAAVGLANSSIGTAAARARLAPDDKPLRLHRNESPYGLSPAAAEALKEAAARSHLYPIEEPKALEEAIARRFGIDKESVLVACGSIEVLKMATEAFCGPSRAAIVAEPTFEAVVGYCPFVRARSVKIKLDPDYKHDLPRMRNAAAQGGGLIFFCNPSNPVGTLVDKERVARLVRTLPRGVVLLADEAYWDYVDSPEFETCLRYVREGRPVVVSRTFSKIYGMAGLRVGYAIGRKDLIKRMAARRLANNPNQLATAAAIAAIKSDGPFVDRVKKQNTEARDYLCREVRGLGLDFIPSETNFVMINAGRPAGPLIEQLKKRNVLVGRLFPSMPNHLRVTIGTSAEMAAFIERFKEVLKPVAPVGAALRGRP